MRTETSLLLWWLGILTFKRYTAVMEAYGGDLDTFVQELNAEMLTRLGCKPDTVVDVLERLRTYDEVQVRADLQKHGVDVCSIEDDIYPAALREIGDPPVFLSYKGDISILSQPLLAVVGTRRMSGYGRRVVETFVPVFARSNIVTVSGLALGVDAAVAKDTIISGGKTVAVLGHGLAKIHPTSNEYLARSIIEHGGLILSEYPLHFEPDVYTFPARNRIIAGLSIGTLVIEAPEKSGSIITAELALEYNRDVFAVPGQIFDEHMAGCHRLITQGHAKLVTSPEEVLRELGAVTVASETRVSFEPSSPDEHVIYTVLSGMPLSMDDLVGHSKLDTSRIGTALTMMELAGAVKNVGGGQWVKI